MTIPTIPPYIQVPNPLSATFAADALAFTQEQAAKVADINATVGAINAAIGTVEGQVEAAEAARDAAQDAQGAAGAAQAGAQAARDAALAAQSGAEAAKTGAEAARDLSQTYAALAGAAIGGGALAGQAGKYPRVKGDESGIEYTGAPIPAVGRVSITGAHTLSTTEQGALVDLSGTFTLGFAPAANLGNGWWCYLRNSGTGDITLDPDGAETIDGISGFVLYPGAVRLVQSNGSNLVSVPLVGGTKTFTSTGSYVWAPGVKEWDGDAIGGGSGGGGGSSSAVRYNGGSGSAGHRRKRRIRRSEITPGSSTTVTIGAGSLGGAGGNTGGQVGISAIGAGDTSIGSLITAKGALNGGSGAQTNAHGNGRSGGGEYSSSVSNGGVPGHGYQGSAISSATAPMVTEWGGPSGRWGGDTATSVVTGIESGTSCGLSGGAIPAGENGADGVKPGDGGGGGAGSGNMGVKGGNGGRGADGIAVIVEMI